MRSCDRLRRMRILCRPVLLRVQGSSHSWRLYPADYLPWSSRTFLDLWTYSPAKRPFGTSMECCKTVLSRFYPGPASVISGLSANGKLPQLETSASRNPDSTFLIGLTYCSNLRTYWL